MNYTDSSLTCSQFGLFALFESSLSVTVVPATSARFLYTFICYSVIIGGEAVTLRFLRLNNFYTKT